MAIYSFTNTALIIVDPYRDFLGKDGKAWLLVKSTVVKNQVVQHLQKLLNFARKNDILVAYAPHHRYRKGSFAERKYLHPAQAQQIASKSFEAGKKGSEFIPELAPKENEFISSEHSCSSGFAGTNLHEHLKSKNITHTIIVGLITNSCIEATVRSAIDLDYHVTLVTDAVAAFSPIEHESTIKHRYPLLGNVVATTNQLLKQLELDKNA